MLIFYQLLTHCCRWRLIFVAIVGVSSSLLAFRLRRLVVEVVVIVVSLLLLFCRCRQQRPFLWLRSLACAPRCLRRLVVVVVVGVASFYEKLIIY